MTLPCGNVLAGKIFAIHLTSELTVRIDRAAISFNPRLNQSNCETLDSRSGPTICWVDLVAEIDERQTSDYCFDAARESSRTSLLEIHP